MQELLKGPPIPAKFAQNAAKDPTKVQEKAQTKPETVQALQQALVKVGTEIGPGPPQTPPAAQNETKPDESFTKLQEKLRIPRKVLQKYLPKLM